MCHWSEAYRERYLLCSALSAVVGIVYSATCNMTNGQCQRGEASASKFLRGLMLRTQTTEMWL